MLIMKEEDRQRAVKAMEESKDDELSKDGSQAQKPHQIIGFLG